MKIKKNIPKQDRSKFMVDAILESATRILDGKIKENFTTNKVAEVAGVSIGSLYQYFKNKESIVEDLLFKKLVGNLDQLFESIDQKKNLSEEVFIETIVREQFDLWKKREKLSKSILKWAPKVLEPKFFLKHNTKIINYLKDKKVEYQLDRIRDDNFDMALMMCINTIRFAILTYFVSEDEIDYEDLLKETTLMVQRYLIL